jgi:hypothetical protein
MGSTLVVMARFVRAIYSGMCRGGWPGHAGP